MKLKLQFIIATIFALAVFIPVAYGQANLTFAGGNGNPLSITLLQPVSYNITGLNCGGGGNSPIFVFDEVGNLLSTSSREVSGTINYSVNGSTPILIDTAQSGFSLNEVTINDLYIYSLSRPGVSSGDTVVLNAGTVLTTGFNFAGAPPAPGSFTTFITNSSLVKCSANGVALGTTAAPVSISGRVLTNDGRGLSNALVYLTDQEGNTLIARTNAFGHYRFADVQAGQSATVTVVSKSYQFASKVINLNEAITDLDFVAEP